MLKNLDRIQKNSFFRGGIYLFAANFATSFFNYLFNIIVAHSLGPKIFGDLTAVFSYVVICTVPLSVVTAYIIQRIGEAGDQRVDMAISIEKYIMDTFTKYWYVIFPFVAIMPFIPKITNLSGATGYILIPLVLLSCVAGLYDAMFQGVRFFLILSLIGVVTTLTKLLGALLIPLPFDDLNTIIFFILLSMAIKIIYSRLVFERRKHQHVQEVRLIQQKLARFFANKQIWIMAAALFAVYCLNNFDIVFAKKYFSSIDAGYYSSWSLLAKIVFYIVGPVMSLVYIFFTSRDQKKHHRLLLICSTSLLVVCAVIIYFGYSLFGVYLVHILFGARFEAVIPYLGEAALFGSAYLFIFFMNQYYIAQKKLQSLILPALLPVYIMFLFTVIPDLAQLIFYNVCFALIMTALYVIVLLHELLVTPSQSALTSAA